MSTLEYAGATDVEGIHHENQDCWFADLQKGLFPTADGMGGALSGKLAADVVAEVFPPLLRQRLKGNETVASSATVNRVTDALAQLSDQLRDESQQHFGAQGMGSTVVLAASNWPLMHRGV